ncbi:MAG TPA: hypothetical protein VGX70_17925, partial [Gemmataceae bacterium]|nr:hypothetical protein [Gemmataceae bacterium]
GGEALQVEGAEAVAKRLNQAEESEADLNDDQFYAAGGLARDGIAEKINKAMATKFPGVKVLEMNDRNELIAIAYAYLQAEIKLTRFYLENREPFNFESSQQKSSPVSAFGVHEYVEKTKDIREQIEVLFADKPRPFDAPQEYALDLCRDSAPNQVVVAVLPKRQTLKDMLHDLEEKMSAFQPEPEYRAFRSVDGLLVPNIHWRIQHHFQELEKKAFANPSLAGTYLDPAIQETTFKLDRSGVFLSSQSEIAPKGGPRHFHFNRPFLLYMKKRGAKHPFFVMWVDNAELLIKK